ncbi:MAG TPA: glycine zipper 2TM domain-containing protein [Rhodocyclaceae bacterium]|nr:glycine zipper 2TM domain-containing protein [Rhodocyclaceae bacterium]
MNFRASLSNRRFAIPALGTLISIAMTACAQTPHRSSVEAPATLPPISTEVYAYPRDERPADEQKRDRFECYNWSVRQTGFDPARMTVTNLRVVHVNPAVPPNHDAAVLGVTGAIIGAAFSQPSNAWGGAAIGAVLGAAAGSASDANREATADHIERAANSGQQAQYMQLSQRAADYRRAMGACLEGRGYIVR